MSFDLSELPAPILDDQIDWDAYGAISDVDNKDDTSIDKKPPKCTYIPPEAPIDESELFATNIKIGQLFDAHEQLQVNISGRSKPERVRNFSEINLDPQLKMNIDKCKFDKLTPIQSVAIPTLLQERDLMACAETGTGKTAAYLIPIVDTILKKQYFFFPNIDENQICCPTALIILPTRELTTQVWLEGLKYSNETNIKMAALYGKTSVDSQISKLKDANIVVATMGRLIHFFGCNYFDFSELRFFIIDEADNMLDLGFNEDIRKIFHEIMKQKMNKPAFQTAMFSATYPYQIRELAADYLDNQIFVTIGRFGGSANRDIYQKLLEVDDAGKIGLLIKILVNKPKKTLVFVDKKTTCDYVTDRLESEKIHVTSIHGDRNQKEREDALRNFKKGKVNILIATSVASRGLDIPGVERVINYNLPFTIEEYIYRIGRTGRLGNKGSAISFYDVAVDSRLQKKLLQIFTECDQIVPSFLHDTNLLWKKEKWDSLKLNFDIERFLQYKLQCDGHNINYKNQWY